MNRITREILEELLLDEECWDKKTRKLRLRRVLDTMHGIREGWFFDEIYFPRLMRAHRMMVSWGIFPADLFEEQTMGWDEEITGLWPINSDLADDLTTRFAGEYWYTNTGKLRSTYIGSWWESKDWAWEEPSEEEILALGITPTLVPAKEGQPALF